MSSQEEDTSTYLVVINDEEQYSIWRDDRPLPAGWKEAGKSGRRSECLEHIERVWTDMRPLSVRRAAEAPRPTPSTAAPAGRNDLVTRLGVEQPLAFVGRPESTRAELEAQLGRGRVFVRFEKTGTELGIRPTTESQAACRDALARGDGLSLEGELSLDFHRVRFVGRLEATTLRGTGRLERIGNDSG